MKPRTIAAALCLALALAPVATATATGARAQGASDAVPATGPITISTTRELSQAIDALLLTGEFDQARRLIARWRPGDPDHAIRIRYVEGRIAAAGDDPGRAVVLYRALLADRPDLERVRVSLAAVLYRLGRDDAARFQAEQLVAAGVDDRAGGALRSIIESIDDRRPLRFSGYASLLPSTNLNNGPQDGRVGRDGRFTIPEEDRRQSGIGGIVGGQAILRRSFDRADAQAPAFVATVDASLRHYPSIGRTLLAGDAGAGVEFIAGRARVIPSVVAGVSMEGSDRTRDYVGLRAEASTSVAPAWRLHTAPAIRHERVAANASGQEDGLLYDLPLRIDRFFGSQRFGRLILGHAGARKDAARFSFDEWRGGLGAFAEVPFGLTLYAQGTYARRDYRDVFPGFGTPREDRRVTGILALTKRDLAFLGFAPRLVYVFERNRSNIVFHDTTRHDVEVRLTREF